MTSLEGSKSGLLDALATDELYQRMLRLRQKYRQAEQELGGSEMRQPSFAFNGTSEAGSAHDNNDSKNGARPRSQQQRRNTHRTRSRSDSACMFINPTHLQSVMRKLMSEIGSCHVDTILEFLRRHWDIVRGGDMIPYNVAECRKHVIQRLRTDTAVFAKDDENEGCWTLSRDEESEGSEIKYYEPQIDCIMRAMEESESGEYTVDYISAYVIKNWARRHPLSDAEIKESVKLTLTTNPRFYYDASVPGGLVYLRAKKQNQLWSVGATEEEKRVSDKEAASTAAATMTTMAPPLAPASLVTSSASATTTTTVTSSASTFIFNSGTAVVATEASQVTASAEQSLPVADGACTAKRSKRNRVLSPPAGYACKCGATTPGKGAACKWRRGPDGEFLCNNCGLQSAKKAKNEKKKDGKRSSPERSTKKDKKAKKERNKETPEDEEEEDEDDEEDEEDSPWICCDNCGQWVLAKDDNIDDVSIYDDSNPNHLDYFCPQCRENNPDLVEVKEEDANSAKENDSTPNGGEEERWSFGEDNEGEESGITSSETTPHLNSANGSRKRNRTASLYSEVDAAKRKVRPRTRSQQNPVSADIMGETVSFGGEGKLDLAEHKIRLEWERTVSHQEGEEVDPEVSELEERFWNDIQKYKTLLTQTRDSLWSKNLVDYKKKKEKLKREREKLDAKAENDLMRQFMEYFKKKKRKLIDEREALIAQRTHNP